jgi:nucleoside-diphosphate-sugar epimerase
VRLLVLGGTWFLGRAIVAEGLRRGHAMTVFNRGRSGRPPVGAGVVHGDRTIEADLAHLAAAGPWDAVVDVPGVVPAQIRNAARALHGVAGRYVFVSTVSVYRDWPAAPVSEGSPAHDADPDADPPDWTWGTGVYGPLKAGAELAVHREYGRDRATIVRPGVILGPGEYGGRLTWWLDRCARGGRILAPGRPDDPIRPIDVRDVAAFLVHAVEAGQGGVFNLAGPSGRDTFGGLLDCCTGASASDGTPVWVDSHWLVERGVRQWTEIPMWRTAAGTWAIDTTHAEAAGLACRPLRDTVADTWEWSRAGGRPVAAERRALHGLAPEREAALLADWDSTGVG